MFNSCEILKQKFNKLSVLSHLESTIATLESKCNKENISANMKNLGSAIEADDYLTKLVG